MKISIKIIFCCTLLFVATAKAENISCLLETKGKTLKWNSSWQNDNQDNRVTYNITDILEDSQNNSTTIVLIANSKANKITRQIIVSDSLFAQTLCDKIHLENQAKENKQLEQNDKLKNIPYIKFAKNSWILAETPQNETLATCYIYSKKYLCSLKDKLSHQSDLKKIEEELKLEVD